MKTAEQIRLDEAREQKADWKQWGPYLSERQWGTVREDYSESGDAWNFFTHDHARSRAYRWGEDGLAGISDDRQHLCLALALWNGKDAILKERLFGLTNNEGNHGEDVKEYYFYLDSTPTHSYMKYLYKYPQSAFPYADLIETNRRRGRNDMEYELLDTGIFNDDRYFDVFVEYAKDGPRDMLMQITVVNRGPDAAELHLPADAVVPQRLGAVDSKIQSRRQETQPQADRRAVRRPVRSPHRIRCSANSSFAVKATCRCCSPKTEPNHARLFPYPSNDSPYLKDGINDYVVDGRLNTVNPERQGHQGRGPLSLDGRSGRDDDGAAAAGQPERRQQARQRRPLFGPGFRRDLHHSPARGRRVLPLVDAAARSPRIRPT